MSARIKATGFTRFLIVMLIVVPLAYFGAAYYNGEDPVEKIKELVKREDTQTSTTTAEVSKKDSAMEQVLREQLDACQQKNEVLNRRIGELEAQLSKKK